MRKVRIGGIRWLTKPHSELNITLSDSNAILFLQHHCALGSHLSTSFVLMYSYHYEREKTLGQTEKFNASDQAQPLSSIEKGQGVS